MYYHCIIMFTDYEVGLRKAYYKTLSDIKELKEFRKEIKIIKGDFKNVKFSFHQVMTSSIDIQSVKEYDSYFDEVIFYSSEEVFIQELKNSCKVTPGDILKYILIKKPCTKLKAMKLIYLIYEEYLRLTDKYLFEEEFIAYPLGPVPVSAYDKLSRYAKQIIRIEDTEQEMTKFKLKIDRIAEKEKIIKSIDNVLEQYGEYSPSTLVNITHESGKPWDIIQACEGIYSVIPKSLIKECL